MRHHWIPLPGPPTLKIGLDSNRSIVIILEIGHLGNNNTIRNPPGKLGDGVVPNAAKTLTPPPTTSFSCSFCVPSVRVSGICFMSLQ